MTDEELVTNVRGYSVYAPKALHPKATVTRGVLEEECRQLMQDFFKEKR